MSMTDGLRRIQNRIGLSERHLSVDDFTPFLQDKRPTLKKLVKHVVQPIYNSVLRPRLPKKIQSVNGVPVRSAALFDFQDHKLHKPGFLDAIQQIVENDDSVVDIAAGYGVCATVAARQGASVISYEAAAEMLEIARETTELSCVADHVELNHAIVAEANDIYGDAADATVIPPNELPDCDVLILDCEGAEQTILEQVSPAPDRVLVEVHPDFGASVAEIRAILQDRGYSEIEETVVNSHGKPLLIGRQ